MRKEETMAILKQQVGILDVIEFALCLNFNLISCDSTLR